MIFQSGCSEQKNEFSPFDFIKNIETAEIQMPTIKEGFQQLTTGSKIFESLNHREISKKGRGEWNLIKSETETLLKYSKKSQRVANDLSLPLLQINNGTIDFDVKFASPSKTNETAQTWKTILLKSNKSPNFQAVKHTKIKHSNGSWIYMKNNLVENSPKEEKYFDERRNLSKETKRLIFEMTPFSEGIIKTEINLGVGYAEGGIFLSLDEKGNEGYFITLDTNGRIIFSNTRGEEGRRYIAHEVIPEEYQSNIKKGSWITLTSIYYNNNLLVSVNGQYKSFFNFFDGEGQRLGGLQNKKVFFGLIRGNGQVVRFRNIRFSDQVSFSKNQKAPMPEAGIILKNSEKSGYLVRLSMEGFLSVFTLKNELIADELISKILANKPTYDEWYSLKFVFWKGNLIAFLNKKFQFFVPLPQNQNKSNIKEVKLRVNNLKGASFRNFTLKKETKLQTPDDINKTIKLIDNEKLYSDFITTSKNSDFKVDPRFDNYIRKVKINMDTRKAISLPKSGKLSYNLTIPKNGILIFSYAIAPQVWDKEGYSHLFQITITNSKGMENKVFSKVLDAMVINDKGWHDKKIDLSEYAGERVKVAFHSKREEDNTFLNNFALYGNPVILTPRQEEDINVILISVDTLRSDHLSSYGYTKITSPFIDKLSEHGTLFKNAISQSPYTLPSHMSIFTSFYGSSHGIGLDLKNSFNNHIDKLPEVVYTLPEVLKDNGYFTLSFNGGSFVSADFGFSQGFYSYNEKWPLINESYELFLNWIQKNRNLKFFMFFHTFEVHEY